MVFPVQDGWGNIDNVIGTRPSQQGWQLPDKRPDWKGEVPEGMKHYRLASNVGFMPGRSTVTSPEDAKLFATTVMDKYTLTPLSRWGKGAPNANCDTISSPLPNRSGEELQHAASAMPTNDYFNRLNALLIDNPPYD